MGKIKNLVAKFNSKQFKLTGATLITDKHIGETWVELQELYRSRDFSDKALATFLNYVVTKGTSKYSMMSQPILKKMIDDDPNWDRTSLNGTEFKAFKKKLMENRIISVLRESSSLDEKKKSGNKAALWALRDTGFCELLNLSDDFKSDEEAIAYFERPPASTRKTTRSTTTDNDNANETVKENNIKLSVEVQQPTTEVDSILSLHTEAETKTNDNYQTKEDLYPEMVINESTSIVVNDEKTYYGISVGNLQLRKIPYTLLPSSGVSLDDDDPEGIFRHQIEKVMALNQGIMPIDLRCFGLLTQYLGLFSKNPGAKLICAKYSDLASKHWTCLGPSKLNSEDISVLQKVVIEYKKMKSSS
jgi:hypothetical protein